MTEFMRYVEEQKRIKVKEHTRRRPRPRPRHQPRRQRRMKGLWLRLKRHKPLVLLAAADTIATALGMFPFAVMWTIAGLGLYLGNRRGDFE